MFRSEDGVALPPALALIDQYFFKASGFKNRNQLYSTRRVFLTRGNDAWNELPSGTNSADWAEQQNLVSPLTRRAKTDVSTPSVRWALCCKVAVCGSADRTRCKQSALYAAFTTTSFYRSSGLLCHRPDSVSAGNALLWKFFFPSCFIYLPLIFSSVKFVFLGCLRIGTSRKTKIPLFCIFFIVLDDSGTHTHTHTHTHMRTHIHTPTYTARAHKHTRVRAHTFARTHRRTQKLDKLQTMDHYSITCIFCP